MWEKFNPYLRDDAIFLSAVVLLVGMGSFALGKLSERPPARAQDGAAAVVVRETALSATTTYIASRNGNSYHLPWCSGAGRIKEENKLVFDSREKAEAAGYAPASNCPGL